VVHQSAPRGPDPAAKVGGRAEAARLAAAELAISSALRTSKNPSLGSIAAATGLDVADLQAGLMAMQKSLTGNRTRGSCCAA